MSATDNDLVDVTVETTLGARYIFPDMPRQALDALVSRAEWLTSTRFSLVNVSNSVLLMEARIIKSVFYDGEVRWKNAAVRELSDPG